MKRTYFLPLTFLVLIVIGVIFVWRKTYLTSTQYTAVFLNNGQVYFGHSKHSFDDFLVLQDVYYLKANVAESATPSAQLALVKLGDELHAPTDEIRINRKHVLFIEQMKSKGVIMDAIAADKKKDSVK